MSDLNQEEKDDINFLSTFLHNCKKFILPIQSKGRSCGGMMWGIGWRKCCRKLEVMGRYINQKAVN